MPDVARPQKALAPSRTSPLCRTSPMRPILTPALLATLIALGGCAKEEMSSAAVAPAPETNPAPLDATQIGAAASAMSADALAQNIRTLSSDAFGGRKPNSPGEELTVAHLVKAFRDLMLKTKHDLCERVPKLYSQDLLNNLFRYPYTKIEFVEKELGVSRVTASKYLEQLTKAGFLRKQRMGKTNFYINDPLFDLLSNVTLNTIQ